MTSRDARGLELSNASAASAAAYDESLALLNAYALDPLATIDAALAEQPDFVSGQLLKAGLLIAAMERTLMPMARECIEAAEHHASVANDRERSLTRAFRVFEQGQFHTANRLLGRHLVDHPRDLLAVQLTHLTDFYLGQSQWLRDRIARVLPYWSQSDAGYSHLLGMYAFGLEECNEYARAEAAGRQALDMQPRDAWAIHAVAHVCEMEGRLDEGVRWMEERRELWSRDNMLAVHNGWHLALYQLERGDIASVLQMYDSAVRGTNSEVVLDMVDASALLWRLMLRGADVGDRWQEIATCWRKLVADRFYAFNDVHAAMAFVGAGDEASAEAVQHELVMAAGEEGSNGAISREVGLPVCVGLRAFGAGRWAECVEVLVPVLPIAHRFGGSHAQRDLLHLTTLEAAMRSGDLSLAQALAAERLARKPGSPSNLALARRAGSLPFRAAA